jgi:hypothetical protein
MNSSMISKIDKAKRYAQEPERITIGTIAATFRGSNGDHQITLGVVGWQCDCPFYDTHGSCAHVMAAQRVLAPMLPEAARYEQSHALTGMESSIISKIDKARRYAQEPERITLTALAATFRGSNDDHALTLHTGLWHCQCHFSETHESCAHTMAMQRLLAPMLPEVARYEQVALTASGV